MHRFGRSVAGLLGALLVAVVLAGCDTRAPSTVAPAGPKAGFTTMAWWILLAVAGFVCIVIITLTVLAAVVRRRTTSVKTGEGRTFVLVLGVIIPSLVFAGCFALGIVGLASTAEPATTPGLTIDVTGHQWWWAARYQGTAAVTANEIHVPVGTPVELRLRTADVIHSFWVPELMPKMDLLPRRVNKTWVTADHPGRFRGECAEYCGVQHAHMDFTVVAEPRAQFRSWLQQQEQDAATPTTAAERHGLQVLTQASCATCHTVRGTSADGHVGPDLTHVGSRRMLAAGTIPNDTGHMSGWIANSQAVKPGNLMPPQPISPRDLHDVVAYLQSLK
ncbi:MAG TPA: cytochrome c oxidase subunit II [Marmoricola sp.]|nr:cytochrome c oxidase subunit II [Marmoricola sp.]